MPAFILTPPFQTRADFPCALLPRASQPFVATRLNAYLSRAANDKLVLMKINFNQALDDVREEMVSVFGKSHRIAESALQGTYNLLRAPSSASFSPSSVASGTSVLTSCVPPSSF